MAFQQKLNSCGLFRNDRHPEKSDFSAQIEIECPRCHTTSHFWVNAWDRVAQSGMKYLNIVLKPKSDTAANREERQ
jgi:hypothetical protein